MREEGKKNPPTLGSTSQVRKIDSCCKHKHLNCGSEIKEMVIVSQEKRGFGETQPLNILLEETLVFNLPTLRKCSFIL